MRIASTCLVLLLVGAAGSAAPAAGAEPFPEDRVDYRVEIVNERPTSSAIARDALRVARRFWAEYGLTGPRPAVKVADEMRACWLEDQERRCEDIDGIGSPSTGITLQARAVRSAARERWRPGDRWRFEHKNNSARVDLCAVLAHELGHVLGRPHAASGVMSYDGTTPFLCKAWRQDLDAAARAAHRARRAARRR